MTIVVSTLRACLKILDQVRLSILGIAVGVVKTG